MKAKNLLVVALTAGFLAGCASVTPSVQPAAEFVDPVAADTGATDPNPFANYGPAMESTAAFPLTVNWQDAHKAEVAEATKPETLAPFVKDAASAAKLLARVGEAYKTDPLVMMQIGAVSQLVMCPTCDKAPAGRAVWTKALLAAAKNAPDAYRALFFLDQLRWCGWAEDAKAVRVIGKASKDKAVADFAEMVARELTK